MRTLSLGLIVGALLACGDDTSGSGGAGAEANTGGASSNGGASGTGASSNGGSTGTGASAGGTTGKPCDPACTGTKLCDDGGMCVCAPGFVFDGADCAPEPISDPTTRTKDEVCAHLAAATVSPAMEWIPGMGGMCDPGTVPFEAQVATLRYLNFYRWMIGVGPVQVDPSQSQAEQECAVMLNYYFGHDPTPDVTCYTALGAQACADSLIAGGYGLVGQVDGYALETGQNFIHHRNVLSVGRAGVWFGASGGSSDMHYGGSYTPLATDPRFVAHPGPGLQVMSKVPLTWWFVERGTESTPPLDARVFEKSTMTPMPMIRQHHYTDFSSFQTDGWTPAADTTYVVELVDDAMAVYDTFETTFINCP